jgi:flap endonuclease-1
MGIKGLTQLLKKYAPESYEHTKLYTLSGKRVAIDASLYIYQSLIMYRKNGDYIRDKNGRNISHILGIMNKTILYLSYNIIPIYIFDGSPPIEKMEVINDRRSKVQEAKNKLNSSNTTSEDVEKYNKQSIRITSDIIKDVKELLNKLGVSYIKSTGEAEGLASELCRQKYVDYVISEDMDCLPFGSTNLVRSCIDKSIKMTDSITIFNLEKILSSLEITHEQFIELCILCGCDYCKNIPRIGSITAYKIIKKYNTIDNYINSETNKNIPNDYEIKYKRSKELLNIFNNQVDTNNLEIKENRIDISILMIYLRDVCELSDSKIHRHINKLQNKYTN